MLPTYFAVACLLIRGTHALHLPAAPHFKRALSPAMPAAHARAPPAVAFDASSSTSTEPMDVLVARGSEGGLGVVVDQDNVVVTVTSQPSLQVGDIILAVDGTPLEGFIGASGLLTPGTPEYTFSIRRQGASGAASSLELNLLKLCKEADDLRRDDRRAQFEGRLVGLRCMESLEEFGGSEAFGERAESLVASLEAASLPPASSDALGESLNSGFWKLALTSSPQVAKEGVTKYGAAPYCTVLASFQAFLPSEPTAQCVEVVANSNVGASKTAALKGNWRADDDDAAGAVESYDRLEYDGAPMFQEEPIEAKWRCTYLSETMRVCRVTSAPATAPQELGAPTRDGPGEEWRVYVKMDPWKAQEEIARLLDRPVPRGRGDSLDDMPDWARRGGVGGYGLRGGDGPAPMADGMR